MSLNMRDVRESSSHHTVSSQVFMDSKPTESARARRFSNCPPLHPHLSSGARKLRGGYGYQRTFSQGASSSKRAIRWSYFSIQSLLLLVCLTASLLILPLVLPPLPPPPFLLLLLPIGILALLMVLAFMPSNVRDLTYYM